ncbi:transcriptional regulator [Paenibacillus ihbetae]|uniref:Transcriptional regulator n=1 Tax=Paenibacillus ihbetae TaxID=1870820 RepID=A0A1B2E6Q7_9BACL|nr:helix-turn-helix transcriptional regulator [Paenibacillus ihbetae]ANY75654.1 transcriptional regulator [Paenibacillus ihbetae]
MISTATIREQITRYIDERGMTINQFARISGINNGTLSNILNGRRPISIKQLDQMTLAMGCSEGHFYEMYIHEYLFPSKPDWRRLGPFLHRCAELNKLDCLDLAARMTLDNTSYLPVLFETAETLFGEGRYEAAKMLYECVAESEKSQHSERLAFCQYRLFLIKLSADQEKNLQAAVHFESFIDKLDECYQLDAYTKIINSYLSLHRWEEIELLSRKMRLLAKVLYNLKRKLYEGQVYPKKPISFYILYAYLMESHSHKERGNYGKASDIVSLYDNPSWLVNPCEEELIIIDQFSEWAKANRYMLKLMSGETDILDTYVKYISEQKDEIYHALSYIMLAANRHDFKVDHILERFKEFIVYQPQKNKLGKISEQVNLNRYTRLLAELGIYYLNAEQYERGLAYIVDSFEYSIRIRSDKGMLRCMGLFEQFRSYASAEIQKRYQELIREV